MDVYPRGRAHGSGALPNFEEPGLVVEGTARIRDYKMAVGRYFQLEIPSRRGSCLRPVWGR